MHVDLLKCRHTLLGKLSNGMTARGSFGSSYSMVQVVSNAQIAQQYLDMRRMQMPTSRSNMLTTRISLTMALVQRAGTLRILITAVFYT